MIETPLVIVVGLPGSTLPQMKKITQEMISRDNRNYIALGMGDIFTWCTKYRPKIGPELKKLQPLIDDHDPIPSEFVAGGIESYIKWWTESFQLHNAFVYDIPASISVNAIRKLETRFQNLRVFHVCGCAEDIEAAQDADLHKLCAVYQIWTLGIASYMASRNPERIKEVKSDLDMREIMRQLIKFTPSRERRRNHWHHVCGDHTHPAGRLVHNIDRNKSEQRRRLAAEKAAQKQIFEGLRSKQSVHSAYPASLEKSDVPSDHRVPLHVAAMCPEQAMVNA